MDRICRIRIGSFTMKEVKKKPGSAGRRTGLNNKISPEL